MSKKTNPIAVFDSGVGGISVLRELVKILPNEDYIYYSGDQSWGCMPGCRITSISIPNSVKYIGEGAFSCCHLLKDISIGGGVIDIGRDAFVCEGIETVNFGGTMVQWENAVKDKSVFWEGYGIIVPTVHCSDGDIEDK